LATSGPGLSASLHFALGLALIELGEHREAAEQMQLCLKKRTRQSLGPVNPDVGTAAPHHCLALCRMRLDTPAAAEEAFQAGLKEQGRLGGLRLDYARFLFQQRRPVDALQCLHHSITENPQDQAAWRLGAEIALSHPECLEFARDWTGEAVRHIARHPGLLHQRALALLLSGDTGAALEVWTEAWELERQPAVLAGLILCELPTGQIQHPPQSPAELAATERAFLSCYRQCVLAGAKPIVLSVHRQLEPLRRVLPEAASVIEAVLREAETDACASR
jgi:tetratricopeptide (TPR) repeat protein